MQFVGRLLVHTSCAPGLLKDMERQPSGFYILCRGGGQNILYSVGVHIALAYIHIHKRLDCFGTCICDVCEREYIISRFYQLHAAAAKGKMRGLIVVNATVVLSEKQIRAKGASVKVLRKTV